MNQFNAIKDAWFKEDTRLTGVYNAAEEALEARAAEISEMFGAITTNANRNGTKKGNNWRRKRRNRRTRKGIRPQ